MSDIYCSECPHRHSCLTNYEGVLIIPLHLRIASKLLILGTIIMMTSQIFK